MKFLQRSSICLFYVMVAVIFAGTAFGATPELPKGLVMNDTFKSGYGAPIGKFRTVQGKVVVMHADKKEGYWAKKNLPLYKGDVIVTQKKSRTNFVMNDKSIISLSSNTKLVLSKSIYDEKKKRRSSFLSLTIGKARFVVSKLLSFKRREFKVKTVTAVCGVRGSKFIIEATLDDTVVTTEDKTIVAVYGLSDPEAAPVIVEDYERTGVKLGQLPNVAVAVPLDEVEMLKKDFVAPAKEDMPEEDTDVQKDESSEEEDTSTGETEEEDSTTEETQEEGTAEEDTTTEETQEEGAAEEDATTEETQEGETTEDGAASEETQTDESTVSDTETEDTQAGASAEGDTTTGETQTDEPAAEEITAGETQESESAATGKTVVVTTGTGDTSPDVSADQDTPADVSPESDIDQTGETAVVETEGSVDPGAVYVSDEVLVEPELPTEIEQPVVDIENIIVDVVQEPEIAEQVAEQILQEDLQIPEMPGTPE